MMKVSYPTEEQVRARAYEIYQARGGTAGHDIDDWLQAEYELMQLPIRKIAELNPTQAKRKGAERTSLVNLVQAALILGAEALPHLRG